MLNDYPYDLCFNLDKIALNISQQFEIIKGNNESDKKNNLSEDSLMKEIMKFESKIIGLKNLEIIKKKYFSKDLDLDNDFKGLNQNIKKYYTEYFNHSKEGNKFINDTIKYFHEAMDTKENKYKIYSIYINNFYIVIKFIETFLTNLLKKKDIIPYSIRVICKIISILIMKRFPNIPIINRNTFICRFFFCALFWPISENSNDTYSVANYLITRHSMKNIEYIEKLFIDFIMGELFINKENCDFSPFNKFFIEKMELLIKFIDDLVNVDLPEFVKKTLEDNNYSFDYLKENENDGIINRSICFKIEDIYDIVINAAKRDNNIFRENDKLKIRYEKFTSNRIFDVLNELDSKAKQENKLYFYLISDCLFTQKYAKKIKTKKQMNYFTLEYKKNPNNNEEIKKNKIIEAKNLLSGLLFNLVTLTKENISENYQKDIHKLLNELSILSKSLNFSINDNITTSWYGEPLINILSELPIEMTKNNCEKLIGDLIIDVNNSIKDLNEFIGTLNMIIDEKLKYIQMKKIFLDKNIKIIEEIDSYKKALNIVNKEKINVGFYIMKNGKKYKFYLNEYNSSMIYKYFDYNTYYLHFTPKIFETITEFINNFPDFNFYFSDLDKKDIFELQEEMNIPNQIKIYFIKINEYINKSYNGLFDEISNNNEKIYNDTKKKLKNILCEKISVIDGKLISKEEGIKSYDKLKKLFGETNDNMKTNLKDLLKELNEIKKNIYDYVMEKLYDKLYPEIPTDEEKKNYEKTILYSWIEPKHLNEKYNNKPIYTSFLPDIIKYFKLFLKEKSPRKKIETMNNLNGIILKAIEFNEGKGDLGSDDIFPLLIYCYIKAQPFGIYSNIKYSKLYNPYTVSGIEVLGLTNLTAAYEFVNNLSFSSLYNITKEEYDKNMNLIYLKK